MRLRSLTIVLLLVLTVLHQWDAHVLLQQQGRPSGIGMVCDRGKLRKDISAPHAHDKQRITDYDHNCTCFASTPFVAISLASRA